MLLIKYSADLSRGGGEEGEGEGVAGGWGEGARDKVAGTPIKETASPVVFLPEINLLLIFDRYAMITSHGTDADVPYRYCITGRYK